MMEEISRADFLRVSEAEKDDDWFPSGVASHDPRYVEASDNEDYADEKAAENEGSANDDDCQEEDDDDEIAHPRAYVADVSSDRIAMKSNFLILSEFRKSRNTQFKPFNMSALSIKFKRNIRAGGVTKYRNNNDSTQIITPQIDIIAKQNQSLLAHIRM
ncbi:hypothetical protein PV326_005885 [Microctonus aethiopoides]|nr:hypothetical protein PV326_005885 [Microctonus aethiopoides]